MNIFTNRKKTVKISEPDPRHQVTYIGNMVITFLKGDGCVDRPVYLLWNNYKDQCDTVAGLDMQLLVCGSGLKGITTEQGVTEYRAHRILYCAAHPRYPRLFVWVYRHENKKMKMDVRCHAVLCSSETKAKTIAAQLKDKISLALAEFTREKTRRQNSRLILTRTNNSVPVTSSSPMTSSSSMTSSSPKTTSSVQGMTSSIGQGVPLRIKSLSVSKNYLSERSQSAPKLGAITEDHEEDLAGNRRSSDSAFRGGHSPNRLSVITEEERGGGLNRVASEEDFVGPIYVTINTRGDMADHEERRLSLDGDHFPLVYNKTIERPPSSSSRRRSTVSDSELLEDQGEEEECPLYTVTNDKRGGGKGERNNPLIRVTDVDETTDTDSNESGFSEQDDIL